MFTEPLKQKGIDLKIIYYTQMIIIFMVYFWITFLMFFESVM